MQIFSTSRLNYPKLAITIIYVTVHGLVLSGAYWLLVSPFSPTFSGYSPRVLAGFIMICWLPCYCLPNFGLLFARIRQPSLQEEQLIEGPLQTVAERTRMLRTYKVWMIDAPGISAFATGRRTIILHTGILPALSPEELSAVLAHETGHLQASDSLLDAPRVVSDLITTGIRTASRWCWHHVIPKVWVRWLILGMVTAILYYCWQGRYLQVLIALFLPGIACFLIKRPLQALSLAESRLTEYRQDVFAQRLGYGRAMIRVHHKILAEHGLDTTTRWSLLWHGTHPFLHHRIRRLEELEREALYQ